MRPERREHVKEDGNWIQGAVHPSRRGVLTAKAKAAGMSVKEYAKHVLASGTANKTLRGQASFALRAQKGF